MSWNPRSQSSLRKQKGFRPYWVPCGIRAKRHRKDALYCTCYFKHWIHFSRGRNDKCIRQLLNSFYSNSLWSNYQSYHPWWNSKLKNIILISNTDYGFLTCILRIFSILIKLQWSILLAYVIGLFFELSCSSWISEFFFSVIWLVFFTVMWLFIWSSSVRGIHSYSSFLQLLPRTVRSSAAQGISSSAAKPSDMIDSSLESDELESNFLKKYSLIHKRCEVLRKITCRESNSSDDKSVGRFFIWSSKSSIIRSFLLRKRAVIFFFILSSSKK